MQPPTTGITYYAIKIPIEHLTLCEGGTLDKIELCAKPLKNGGTGHYYCDSSVDSTTHLTYPSVDCSGPAICEYFDISAFFLQDIKVLVTIYMKSIDGISYPWALYEEDQLLEIKLSCGGETLTIVPAYKESFKLNDFEVAKVIQWPTIFSYFTTKMAIKFEGGDPTSVI